MSTSNHSKTVTESFFQPLQDAIAKASSLWLCPEFPDDEWIRMGVQRVLEGSESGRGFLQEHGLRFENPPNYANYFAALRSQRRGDLAREVNSSIVEMVESIVCDRLVGIPELANPSGLAPTSAGFFKDWRPCGCPACSIETDPNAHNVAAETPEPPQLAAL